jgi:hypothetical protein
MALTISSDSHLDHYLTPEHLAWIQETFANRDGFFIETVTLPEHLGEVPSAIYGPSVGDPPVAEVEVRYIIRGSRKCASRVVHRPSRMTRTMTVIAGPHGDQPCVLYTAYGGPCAPREPGDPGIPTWEELQACRAFWAEHALGII